MMALPTELRDASLTLDCPQCGHALTKKGSWFMAGHRFKCEGCQREVRLTYAEKIKLFARHTHLIRRSK
jgi:transposase-like protein